MNVNFNILNQKDAPAIYEDSLINRPAPSFRGRLFVDTDAPTSTGIYRDTGTSWQLIAAPGSTPPPVLNIYTTNGTLNFDRTLNGANRSLVFLNLLQFNMICSNNIGLSINGPGQKIETRDLNGFPNGFLFEYNIKQYTFGQRNGGNTTSFFINDTTQQIYTKNGGNLWGLYFDFLNNDYRIGRLSGNGSQMFLTPNVATMNLGNGTTTQAQCGLTASQCNFGFIPALGGELRFIGSNFSITGITSYIINGTGITSGTSGSTSGQHLKITINGTPYVIELKNP